MDSNHWLSLGLLLLMLNMAYYLGMFASALNGLSIPGVTR